MGRRKEGKVGATCEPVGTLNASAGEKKKKTGCSFPVVDQDLKKKKLGTPGWRSLLSSFAKNIRAQKKKENTRQEKKEIIAKDMCYERRSRIIAKKETGRKPHQRGKGSGSKRRWWWNDCRNHEVPA